MTEQPKYYTPELKEFHTGFEFEYLYRDKWHKHNLDGNPIVHHELDEFKDDLMKIAHAICRVKLLDKEDIESLGWEKSSAFDGYIKKQTPLIAFILLKYNTGNNIQLYKQYLKEDLNGIRPTLEEPLLKGILKNKSELKNQMERCGIV